MLSRIISSPQAMDWIYNLGRPAKLLYVAKPYRNMDEKRRAAYERKNRGMLETPFSMKSDRSFCKERGPGSYSIRSNIATYPGKYEQFSLYTPELFQKFMQLRRINKGDLLILYDRCNMVASAFFYSLLEMYGFKDMFVLEGGLESWKHHGFSTVLGPKKFGTERAEYDPRWAKWPLGTWEAGELCVDRIASYEDVMKERVYGQYGEVNLLFCSWRPMQPQKTASFHANFPGSIIVPISSLTNSGELNSAEQILDYLHRVGCDFSKPIYTMCYDGSRAPMLGLALEKAGIPSKRFNGGLYEIFRRWKEQKTLS